MDKVEIDSCPICQHFPTQFTTKGPITSIKAMNPIGANELDTLDNFLALLQQVTENDPESRTFELRLGNTAVHALIEALKAATNPT